MQTTQRLFWSGLLFLIVATATSAAFAHSGGNVGSGFVSGLLHPIGGLDHVTAMVAVGILGAFLGKPAIWVLPIVFPLVMAFGGILGILGIPIPLVEPGIAMSSVVLGVLIVLAARPPLWVASLLVGIFAIFHGYAHGTELPGSASPLPYSAGFIIATGLLHLVGIAIGEMIRWPAGKIAARAIGGLIALAGVGFLTGAI